LPPSRAFGSFEPTDDGRQLGRCREEVLHEEEASERLAEGTVAVKCGHCDEEATIHTTERKYLQLHRKRFCVECAAKAGIPAKKFALRDAASKRASRKLADALGRPLTEGEEGDLWDSFCRDHPELMGDDPIA
jgi:hypothetical protein